jgi:hypothetical protein
MDGLYSAFRTARNVSVVDMTVGLASTFNRLSRRMTWGVSTDRAN